tara:strand:+ start:1313 stop:2311 length:999 start_codon:yes stop_codon:yes gene_type:complete
MNTKKIYFVEKSIPFNSDNLNSHLIAGSEKTLINISSELSKYDNLEIKVFNLTKQKKKFKGLEWNNLNEINSYDIPDFLIAMSDANLLSLIKCKKKFLWSHSVQPFEKFLRKKQLFAFIKNKPTMILEGKYHYETRSFLTSFYGKKILPISVDYDFIDTNVDENLLPNKNAIFTTRPDRNIEFLLSCWTKIFEKSKNSSLYINPPYNLKKIDIENNVKLRLKGNKSDLIKDLLNSRVLLNPGHKGEVFCLAAEEARELCVPIVTMGYGSLKERVDHKVTGFIAKNFSEFIDYSIRLLNDKELYFKIKKNLIKKRNTRNYKNVAEDLLKIITK